MLTLGSSLTQYLTTASFAKCAIALVALGALTACGGGGQSQQSLALTPAGQVHKLAVGSEVGTSVEMIFTMNDGVPLNRGTTLDLAYRVVGGLDFAKVPFEWQECGAYVMLGRGTSFIGSPDGYVPLAVTVAVAAADVSKAEQVGARVRGADGHEIVLQSQCDSHKAYVLGDVVRLGFLAARLYPEDFHYWPAYQGVWNGYEYVAFQDGMYLGVKDGRVIVHNGRKWNLQDVGKVSDYIAPIQTGPAKPAM